MKCWSIALVLAAAAGSAAATPIYRCGQTYSQTPCPNGRIIDSSDPRSGAQRAEARRVAEKERQLAEQMERDRKAKDAASAPAGAAGFDARASAPSPVAASAPAKTRKKPARQASGASGNGVVMITPRKPKPPAQ